MGIDKLGPAPRRVAEVLALLLATATVGTIVYWTAQEALFSYEIEEVAQGTVPFLVWIPKMAMPLGAGLLLVAILDELARVIAGFKPAYVAAAEDRIDHQAINQQEAREAALGKEVARADYLPGPLVDRLIAGESPIRIWREHRGLTLTALAEMASVSVSYLSEIEGGRKPGSAAARRALAGALRVPMEDLA
jgi:DNA-binding transcriptional regulator YiaG